jgi:putative chitinase
MGIMESIGLRPKPFIPMHDLKAFFAACRATVMGPTLDGGEVSGSEAILRAMAGTPTSWCAYALATAWHETAHTMQPIKEYGGPSYFTRMYDIRGQRPQLAKSMGNTKPGDGARYCGRGYVQLTWHNNYARAEIETGHPLVANPDLAMRPDVAATIMRKGMEEGWFTGRAFDHFLPRERPATREQFVQARRIINGSDKAPLIAKYAGEFQDALIAGGWA